MRANWIKCRLPIPSDPRVHERLLAYISDWGLLETSVFPHEIGMWERKMQMASLSHTMHFHRPFKLDEEWVCHAMYVRSRAASEAGGERNECKKCDAAPAFFIWGHCYCSFLRSPRSLKHCVAHAASYLGLLLLLVLAHASLAQTKHCRLLREALCLRSRFCLSLSCLSC